MAADLTQKNQQARRSALYVPGSNTRALEKAKSLDADVLILDLEDSVSPERKDEARRRVLDCIASGDYADKELVVRVNGIGTHWHVDDMSAIAALNPAGVVVPKVEAANQVQKLAEELDQLDSISSLWLMIETPRAIRYIYEIAEASDRTEALVFGTNDLVTEMGGRHVRGRAPLLSALGSTVMAARASGIVALDGVYNDVSDRTGFEAECIQSRDFGFDGKTLIHPSQVEPTNSVFMPSSESVEDAQEVIAAFEAASALGSGVTTVNGRMIERLHVREAERILRLASLEGKARPKELRPFTGG